MREKLGLIVSLLVIGCSAPPGAQDAGQGGGSAGGSATAGGSGTGGGNGTAGGSGTGGGAAGGAGGGVTPPLDGGTIDALAVAFERATPEQIAVHAPFTRIIAADATVAVRYRGPGDATWRIGHPLLRIQPSWIAGGAPTAPVDAFAGTIFGLSPGQTYLVELTLSEPGQAAQTMVRAATTRALPGPAPAATVAATPTDNLQMKLDALTAGSVLQLADGMYTVDALALKVSGTATAPIIIRGTTREGTVIKDTDGFVLQLQNASHVILENLTLEGSNTDSGTNAGSVGISFWDGGVQEYVTLRNLDLRGVDMGIVASGTTRSLLIYGNRLRGNNLWNAMFVESNLTWNDDGIRIPGEGNCAFENTLHGFGDTFAVADGVHSAAVYFYRNRVTMTGDDAFESDYGTRNLAFYDNHITNASTFLSCDPIWGGPLYAFRNIIINTVRGPYKLNNTNAGFLIYNNTIVRTEGNTGWGWVQFNNGDQRGWSYRNNLLIYRGSGNKLLALESGSNTPIDFTHNAWFPDGEVWWSSSGGSYDSIAAARAGLPATTPLFGASAARHTADVITTSDPFSSAVPLGTSYLTEVTAQPVPALDPASTPKNAGIAIPNVTDGFSGAAPDMGAIISGRPLPTWGATRP